MSLTALAREMIQSTVSMLSVVGHTSELRKSPAALKMYLSYLGLWRMEKVLLSY